MIEVFSYHFLFCNARNGYYSTAVLITQLQKDG